MSDIGEFDAVPVMPVQSVDHGGKFTRCGPLWPDWDSRTFERHLRNRSPSDTQPTLEGEPADRLPPGLFWCGPLQGHFGHQIADFSMRILPSRFAEPGAKLLFSMQKTWTVPKWFEAILSWCEVTPDDVIFLREAAMARQLRVVSQPEQLWNVGPSAAHLDALDRFIAAKRLNLEQVVPPVFVSRGGLPARNARFAGERYIEHCVRQAGGIVLRPETIPVLDQITLYLSARRLIFTEGSALHLLQFAGRSFSEVFVLQRRHHFRFDTWVSPRARSFRALQLTKTLISGLTKAGVPARFTGISIPDPEATIAGFREAGLDLRGHFDPAQFVREAVNDLIDWIDAHTLQTKLANWRESDNLVADGLKEAGLDSLARMVIAKAAAVKDA